jgi:hypothetical protein
MRPRLALVVLLPVAAIVLLFAAHGATGHPTSVTVSADGTLEIPAAARAAGLRFAPTVTPNDRAWILAAIAGARPEARRLIDEVDGLVTINTAAGGADGQVMEMGYTRPMGTQYAVGVNSGELDGRRAIDRNTVVLHELGHVIDFALIPPALDARLDAGIPPGGACGDSGTFGSCAPAAERFADTFAKWALNGAVSDYGSGYQIPMPASIETWGEPLGLLAATLPPA